ncbi:MAG: hypothetical protein A3F42_00245 [Gammaproteobacteria bacterium RIFCSPHIGHO2_12_FULL_37_34]|nr:MAG: hypothetical protein A3F42_00245 [Gammaproteobacteria bacterium RIFCSPHIGHO2_12_FULL_37_34]
MSNSRDSNTNTNSSAKRSREEKISSANKKPCIEDTNHTSTQLNEITLLPPAAPEKNTTTEEEVTQLKVEVRDLKDRVTLLERSLMHLLNSLTTAYQQQSIKKSVQPIQSAQPKPQPNIQPKPTNYLQELTVQNLIPTLNQAITMLYSIIKESTPEQAKAFISERPCTGIVIHENASIETIQEVVRTNNIQYVRFNTRQITIEMIKALKEKSIRFVRLDNNIDQGIPTLRMIRMLTNVEAFIIPSNLQNTIVESCLPSAAKFLIYTDNINITLIKKNQNNIMQQSSINQSQSTQPKPSSQQLAVAARPLSIDSNPQPLLISGPTMFPANSIQRTRTQTSVGRGTPLGIPGGTPGIQARPPTFNRPQQKGNT